MADDEPKQETKTAESRAEQERVAKKAQREAAVFEKNIQERQAKLDMLRRDRDSLLEKINGVQASTPKKEIEGLEHEIFLFLTKITTQKKIIQTAIKRINDPNSISGAAQRDALNHFLEQYGHMESEINESRSIIDAALGRKPRKVESKEPADELEQFREARTGVDALDKAFKKFYEKNKDFKISEYFGLRKVDMNMADLKKLSEEMGRHAREHGIFLDQIIRNAASFSGISISQLTQGLFEDKNPNDLVVKIAVNEANRKKFTPEVWNAITKLNAMAIKMNSVNESIQKKTEDVAKKMEELNQVAIKVREAEIKEGRDVRKEIESRINADNERAYNQVVRNASALADARALYAPLTPAEAEKIRRKQALWVKTLSIFAKKVH